MEQQNQKVPSKRDRLIKRLQDLKEGELDQKKTETLPIRMEKDLYYALQWWAESKKTFISNEVREFLVDAILETITDGGAFHEKFIAESTCKKCDIILPSPWEKLEHDNIKH